MSKRPNLSRRTIMTGVAALPAVAVLPAVSAEAASEPDAIMNAYAVVLADLRMTRDEIDRMIKTLEAERCHVSSVLEKLTTSAVVS